ncbi:MAG: hypothetical protein ACRCZI_00610 [Cetobacterium sp.]
MNRVIYRKWKKTGTVIAFFIDQPGSGPGFCTSYEHIGQHGDAIYPHPDTVPATIDEYLALHKELVSQGYDDLLIVRRRGSL